MTSNRKEKIDEMCGHINRNWRNRVVSLVCRNARPGTKRCEKFKNLNMYVTSLCEKFKHVFSIYITLVCNQFKHLDNK